MNKCWICNELADSGEHKIKKSDLKNCMSDSVSQKNPIYHRRNGNIKRPIGSLNSNAFKYNKSICANCNGTLTQPYDYSWSQLSNYISNKKLNSNSEVDLNLVFHSNVGKNLVNIQLFFAKQFGCKVIESRLWVEFDLTETAEVIKNGNSHPNIYLKVRQSNNGKTDRYCAVSDIEILRTKEGDIRYVHFFYTIGKYTVDVLYSENTENLVLDGYIQPNNLQTFIPICEVL